MLEDCGRIVVTTTHIDTFAAAAQGYLFVCACVFRSFTTLLFDDDCSGSQDGAPVLVMMMMMAVLFYYIIKDYAQK